MPMPASRWPLLRYVPWWSAEATTAPWASFEWACPSTKAGSGLWSWASTAIASNWSSWSPGLRRGPARQIQKGGEGVGTGIYKQEGKQEKAKKRSMMERGRKRKSESGGWCHSSIAVGPTMYVCPIPIKRGKLKYIHLDHWIQHIRSTCIHMSSFIAPPVPWTPRRDG